MTPTNRSLTAFLLATTLLAGCATAPAAPAAPKPETVTVADAQSGDEVRYQIVGDDEADSKKGLISYNSPIAKALIGKAEGDVVEVVAPGGRRELEIVAVEYV